MNAPLRARIAGKVRTLGIVLGDQLDRRAKLIRDLDPGKDALLMMEVGEEAGHVPSHRQRTALFLSAMRHFAIQLQEQGHRISYVRLDSPGNRQTFSGEVVRAVQNLRPRRLALTHPGEWRVLEMTRSWERELNLPVVLYRDEHFTATLEEFEAWARSRKQLVMEYFYREQRRKLGILLAGDGKPAGGRWNYDRENRQSFRSLPPVPGRYTARPDGVTREVLELVQRRFPGAPGKLDGFGWPVTPGQAGRALADFIKNRLAHFGPYQDAMWTGEPWLYHSMISSSLNLKILSVKKCLDAAVDAWMEG